MPSITVLLAEDHPVVREDLRALLESFGGIEVVGAASTGREAVELATQLLPAVVVMDLATSLLDGLGATREILRTVPNTRVIVLYSHTDDTRVEQIMALGAAGYLLKQTSTHFLSRAIQEVQAGITFFCPLIATRQTRVAKPPGFRSSAKNNRARLSTPEAEVLRLIAAGSVNKLIATELAISAKTVMKHRRHLREKLNLRDAAGLSRHAVAAGVVESDVTLTLI